MDKSTKLTLETSANGSSAISNGRTMITIQPDGTVAISSLDPVQLTGASFSKLVMGSLTRDEIFRLSAALSKRLVKSG